VLSLAALTGTYLAKTTKAQHRAALNTVGHVASIGTPAMELTQTGSCLALTTHVTLIGSLAIRKEQQ